MSYLNQAQDPGRRATPLTATAAVHVVLAAAVITGLTVAGYTPQPSHIPTIDFPIEQPPPKPEPEPSATIEQSYVAPDPRPPLDLTQDPPRPTEIIDIPPPQTSLYPSGDAVTPPSPQPPRFTPKRATPSNSSAGWITNNDYPRRELVNGDEGSVGYRLAIDLNGRVANCELTRPSGVPGLDNATCRLISRRARFEPATDETGARVAGSYTGSVRWQIPD